MSTPLKKRSIVIAGHATSISVEEPFWEGLTEIAKQRKIGINALIREIDENRHTYNAKNLSSAVRIFVLSHFKNRQAPTDD